MIIFNKAATDVTVLKSINETYEFTSKFSFSTVDERIGIVTGAKVVSFDISFAGALDIQPTSDAGSGMDLRYSADSRLMLAAGSSITSNNVGVILRGDDGSAHVTNRGTINAGTGIFFDSRLGAAGDLVLVNTGKISASSSALLINSDGSFITNNGTLTTNSSTNATVFFYDRDPFDDKEGGSSVSRLVNNGKIIDNSIGTLAVQGWETQLNLVNTGTITGNVLLGNLADTVTMGGTMTGNIDGAGGLDRVTVTGTVSGTVSMGNGSDVLKVSGSVGGNIDMGEGDDLVTLFKADKAATGAVITANISLGSGGDTIIINSAVLGGTINGGTGDDSYLFNTKIGVTVTDTGGVDSITAAASVDMTNISGIETIGLIGKANLQIVGNGESSMMFGNSGDNTITALGGNDTIRGRAGTDTINAGAGVDFLDGGAGNDLLAGGADFDSFVLAKGGGIDTVTDFDTGTDAISVLSQYNVGGIDDLVLVQQGADTFVHFAGRPEEGLLLLNVTATNLTDSNFAQYMY